MHGMMRLPSFTYGIRSDVDRIPMQKQSLDALHAWALQRNVCTEAEMSPMGGIQKHRKVRSSNVNPNKRRRGVRKWVMRHQTTDAHDAGLPEALLVLLEWFLQAMQQIATFQTMDEDRAPWHQWALIGVEEALNHPSDHVVLYSLMQRTVQVLARVPAHSSRNESIQSSCLDVIQTSAVDAVQCRSLAPQQ